MPDLLFDNVVEPFRGPKPYGMPLYEYLARSDRSQKKRGRLYWNQVFSECSLPKRKKSDIRSRFRDRSGQNHLGALTELITYQLLLRSGFSVGCPEIQNGNQPDFLVGSGLTEPFYVEATCILGNVEETPGERFRRMIHELVWSIESERFRVFLTFRGNVSGPIRRREFKRSIEGWLKELDYSEILRMQQFDLRPAWGSFPLGSGTVELYPIAIASPRSSLDYGLVSFARLEDAKLIITEKYMRNKLKDKGKQLTNLGLPAMLVVNILGQSMEKEDTLGAFFEKRGSMLAGVWTFAGRPVNRSMEAVLILRNLGHDAFPSQEPLLILNPYVTNHRIPLGLGFARYFLPSEDGKELRELSRSDSGGNLKNADWRTSWPLLQELSQDVDAENNLIDTERSS